MHGNDRIAAWLNSYKSAVLPALQAARRDGFSAVQLSAAGELHPRELTASGRRHLYKILRDLGLHLPSIALEFPGAGLADPASADARIDAFRETLKLCADLRVPLAEVSIAGFEDARHASLARDVLKHAVEQADRGGVRLAIRSHSDDTITLARELGALDCPTAGLALHTDQLSSGSALNEQTVRLVASAALRDGRRVGGEFEETALGRGNVDLPAIVSTLEQEDFQGPLIVRRTSRSAAVDGLRADRDYVAALLSRHGR